MKKLVSLLLATMMLLSCVPVAFAADTTEIDVMIWYRDIDDLNFAEMEYYNDPEFGITAQSGVHANFNQVKGADWSTRVNLMLNSGEYPDVVVRGGLNLEMYGVDQGILLPLDDYIDQYMPNYKALLDADPELARSLRSSDGKMYQIGWLIPQNINTDSHLFINTKWLEAAGLDIPATIDEFETVLRAFRDLDVDGDGDTTDEIPLGGGLMDIQNGILSMLRLWGIVHNGEYIGIDDNNQVYSWLQDPNLRAAMEKLHEWYAEGLIDVEVVSQDTNAFEAKVNAADYGIFWRWRMTAMGTTEDVYSQYECILPMPAGEEYEVKLPLLLELPAFGAALTLAAEENGNIEAACRWLDTQFQWENMLNGYNGMQGDGWYYGDDGKVVIAEMFDGSREVPGQSSMYYCSGAEYFAKVDMPSHRIEKTSYCDWYTENGLIENNSRTVLTNLCTYTVQESESIELLKAEIDKFAQESMVSFITNGVTDDSWSNYLKTLDNLRISEYLGIRQAAYDRYLENNQ